MIASSLIGLLGGLLLGGRFKVFATLPVQIVALIAAAVLVVSGASTFGHAGLGFVMFSLCLQGGYIARLFAGPRPVHSFRASPFEA